VLEELTDVYKALDDKWRAGAFSKFHNRLATIDSDIRTENDIENAKTTLFCKDGSSCMQLLRELVITGRCVRLFTMHKDVSIAAMAELAKIWGLGPAAVRKLVVTGIKSVAELRQRVHLDIAAGTPNKTLTERDRVCLEHYEDLLERIPCLEVEALLSVVKDALTETCQQLATEHNGGVYQEVTAEALGSYRRGRPFSGDLDVMVTHPSWEVASVLLQPLLKNLKKRGFLVYTLASSKPEHGAENNYCRTCMLLAKLPDNITPPGVAAPGQRRVRRVDIKIYDVSVAHFARLYFTGSGHFNRSMRLWAKRMGLSLSDKGLVDASGKTNERLHANYLTTDKAIKTEEDIFAALGLKYVPPQCRNM
jgi:DNA polymerase/3'-5' exonuclease PolX